MAGLRSSRQRGRRNGVLVHRLRPARRTGPRTVRRPGQACQTVACPPGPDVSAAVSYPAPEPDDAPILAVNGITMTFGANVALVERPIPGALWSDLRGEGLIRLDAPLPLESANAAQY